MLPTNPQSLNASDRAILDNLKQQGEQIDRQTKVLETLVDKVTRQMRSDERLEKNSKKEKNEIKGDTKLNDIPGILFDRFSDKLNDSLAKYFNSIKDKFKDEKAKPIDKSQEPALKSKDKQPKDEKDVLKSILNGMVSSSKYQEQMLEHTKSLQSIADKTLVGITELKNNIQNVEQPMDEVSTDSKETPVPEKKEKNKKVKADTEKLKAASNDNVFDAANDTAFNEEKLPDAIGTSIGKALTPQFDVLGKRLKDGFDDLAYAISNIDTGTGLPPLPVAAAATAPVAATTAATTGLATAGVLAGTVTGVTAIGAGLTAGATNAISNATDEELGMLSADIGSDTGIASAALLEARQPKPKEQQASVRKIDNQIANAEAERNAADKKKGGGYTEGRLERRADKIKPEYLKWAQKFYNDPNLQDPDYLSLPENKGILNLLEERQQLNMKTEPENIKTRKNKNVSLMQEVTNEKTELASADTKSSAPIVINNTNNSTSGQESNMTFAAATSKNPSTAINDYFRNGARFYDAVS
jgi:hypothetical protein